MITLGGQRPPFRCDWNLSGPPFRSPGHSPFYRLVRVRQILARPGPAAGGARSAGLRQAGQQCRYRGAAQPLAAQGITVGFDEAAPDAMLAGAAPGP
jgi:hypothetical protein